SRMAWRASLTQSGQSESVCRGQPNVGLVFSQDLSNGLSDHFGVNEGLGLRLLKNCMALKVTPAVLQTTASSARMTCVVRSFRMPVPSGYKNVTHLPDGLTVWSRNRAPNQAPGAHYRDCPIVLQFK